MSSNSTRMLLILFITAGVLVGLDVGCARGAMCPGVLCSRGADVKTRASVTT
jgi:hypothetical protein